MSTTAYVTKARLRCVEGQLRPRQWAILRDVDRLGIVSGKQLRGLHYEDSSSGRRMARLDLADLTDWQVITRVGRTIGGQRSGSGTHSYALGLAGQRLVRPGLPRYRPPWSPRPNHLRHGLAVSQLYADLRQAERSGLIGLARFDAEPACWRRYFGPGGGRLWLKPDALVVLRAGAYEDRYWLEWDNATEQLPRIAEKARGYLRYFQTGAEEAVSGVFPQALWIVPDRRRHDQLVATLARLPAEHWPLFAVVTIAEAVDRLADGSPTPITNERKHP